MNTSDNPFESGLVRQQARQQLTRLLGEQQVQTLQKASNFMGFWSVLSCWLSIAVCLFVIDWSLIQAPLWLAIGLIPGAIAILGGRLLGLSILMHEASHRTLFKNRWLNDVLSDWLCARPVFLSVEKYRKHHALHHVHTGTDKDVDESLIRGFPTTRRSLLRKFTRDLLGITSVKNSFGLILMNAGLIRWTVASDIERLDTRGLRWYHYIGNFLRNTWPSLVVHTLLITLLMSIGKGYLYLAWIAAYMIPYPLFIRIRAIAEHAQTEPGPDMLKNTRTTRAGYLARATVAPFNVNYHIEHHALVNTPWWQLPRLHRLLRDQQAVPEPPGYLDVLKQVSTLTPHT